jgi:hypothetical protein
VQSDGLQSVCSRSAGIMIGSLQAGIIHHSSHLDLVVLHHHVHILVVPKGHLQVLDAAALLVDAELACELRVGRVLVQAVELREDAGVWNLCAHNPGVAAQRPLRPVGRAHLPVRGLAP